MHITAKQCPVLLRSNLHELFPAPEVYNKGPLTMVTLTCRKRATAGGPVGTNAQTESDAKAVSSFVFIQQKHGQLNA